MKGGSKNKKRVNKDYFHLHYKSGALSIPYHCSYE